MTPHVDPLAHPDPDRRPTHGPLGPVYIAVYLVGFFLLMPACGLVTFACVVNRWPLPGLIGLVGTLFFGYAARAAWRRMP